MVGTPDQKREINRLVNLFSKDFEYLISTKEIRRKKKTGFYILIDFLWKRKYKVKVLYTWVLQSWIDPKMSGEDFPMDHDYQIKPENLPTYFSLQKGWTIPNKDLKTLTNGPLLGEDGNLLVKPGGKISYYWNKIWPTLTIIATFGGIIRFIFWIINLIK